MATSTTHVYYVMIEWSVVNRGVVDDSTENALRTRRCTHTRRRRHVTWTYQAVYGDQTEYARVVSTGITLLLLHLHAIQTRCLLVFDDR